MLKGYFLDVGVIIFAKFYFFYLKNDIIMVTFQQKKKNVIIHCLLVHKNAQITEMWTFFDNVPSIYSYGQDNNSHLYYHKAHQRVSYSTHYSHFYTQQKYAYLFLFDEDYHPHNHLRKLPRHGGCLISEYYVHIPQYN